jgi:TonB family protein
MSDVWKLWESEIVSGKFQLVRCLGGSEHSAVFLTERRDGERLVKAAIKIVPTSPENGELQLSRWQQTAELSHPHLLPLYETGRSELRGVPFVYAVMECAEENLAQVLHARALTPAETREMLDSVVDVLAYLHGKGFVHGNIKPANIMASGDQLKISSDGLRRAGERLDSSTGKGAYDAPEMARDALANSPEVAAAGDVWSLGMTLVETLTQNLPVMRTAQQQDPQFPQSLPEPFLDIAHHCLLRRAEGRWTIAQISARLHERAPVPAIQTVPAKAPAAVPAPARQPMGRPPLLPGKVGSYALPVAIAFALALTAILAGPKLFRHHTDASPVSNATEAQPVVPSTASQSAPSPQKNSSKAHKASSSDEARSSKAPVPVPAILHPDTMHEEETNTVARMPAGSAVRGEVVHQAMPEVLESARNSIRGKLRVSVKVNVDRSGNVEDAELESRGPSKYFARAAVDAARNWKFRPAKVGGQGVLSTWLLRFEFTRGGTTVVPTQEMP